MIQTRVLLIVNEHAAGSHRVWPAAVNALRRVRPDLVVHNTSGPGDATAVARAAIADGCDLVIAVGGDGTISETAEGFFDLTGDSPRVASKTAALALIPAGTGDDFARGLAGGRKPLNHWLARVLTYLEATHAANTPRDTNGHDELRMLDVIYCRADGGTRKSISLNMASLGLSAQVVEAVARHGAIGSRLPGEARFLLAALRALRTWREHDVRVELDDAESLAIRSNLLAISNCRFAGGGMMFAPDAVPDDGLGDVLLTSGLTRRALVRELLRVRKGKHVKSQRIEMRRAAHMRVSTIGTESPLPVEADGNPRGYTPAEFSVLHRVLRVVC